MSEKAMAAAPAYDMVLLRKEAINVSVVQSIVRTVDAKNPRKGMRRNLDHMCWLIDNVQGYFAKNDLLVFHEFPIAGWCHLWDRKDFLNVAIGVPGPETEALGKKAKEHNCYISFGSVAMDEDWPGHFMNMGIIIGPSGDVIYKHWKSRNIPGYDVATSVYDVLDEYVERYGWDAVWPVARTDIGNIAVMPEVYEPEMARVYAIKGTELLIRYMTAGGGGEHFRMGLQVECMSNNIYGVFVNQAASPQNKYYEDCFSGYSGIVDAQGKIIADATSHHETVVSSSINMGSFRKQHSIPMFYKELFQEAFEAYVPRFRPNAYRERLPLTLSDNAELYYGQARW